MVTVKQLALTCWCCAVLGVAACLAEEKGPILPPTAVTEIQGQAAQQLLALEFATEIIVGERSDGRAVTAVVVGDPSKREELYARLFSPEIPGCELGGPYACCNSETRTRYVSTEHGWANLGEYCTDFDNESGGNSSVIFVPLEPDLFREINKQTDILYNLLNFTAKGGTKRILVAPLIELAELRSIDQPAPVGGSTKVDVDPLHWLMAAQVTSDCRGPFSPVCKNDGNNHKCRTANAYWYVRKQDDTWCREALCCKPNCVC